MGTFATVDSKGPTGKHNSSSESALRGRSGAIKSVGRPCSGAQEKPAGLRPALHLLDSEYLVYSEASESYHFEADANGEVCDFLGGLG